MSENLSMVWNVFRENMTSRDIEVYNVMEHGRFAGEVVEIYKKYCLDFPKFETEVKRSLEYYFRYKCEWEIVLNLWPPIDSFKGKKISVYDQVMLNWDAFITKLWQIMQKDKEDETGKS